MAILQYTRQVCKFSSIVILFYYSLTVKYGKEDDMIGLFVSGIYALALFLFGNSWPEIYFCSTLFLFKWYFVWSFILCLLVIIFWICMFGFTGLLAWEYETKEYNLLWLNVTLGAPYALLTFFLKRVIYVAGAYFLNHAVSFDPSQMPAYRWTREDLFYGIVLITIGVFLLRKNQIFKIKQRKPK